MRIGRLRIEWDHPTPPPLEPAPEPLAAEPEIRWLTTLPPGEARSIREDAGWTQADVARHIGVLTPSMVGKYERHGTGWSRTSGLRYARLLQELSVMRDDVAPVVTERTQL